MAARQTSQRRERRAKLALGVLGLVLVGVLGFEGARALVHRSSGSAAAPATTAAPAAGGRPVALTLAAGSGPTKLTRFTGLRAKDPFEAHVSAASEGAAATTSAAPPAPTTTRETLEIEKPPAEKSKPSGPLLPAALLRLNGKKQVVAVGRSFPAGKPVFRLAAVGRSSMWISLLHGSFGGGERMLKVAHGHPAKLVSSGDGKLSFLLALVRVTARRVPPTPQRPGKAPPPVSTTTFTTTTR